MRTEIILGYGIVADFCRKKSEGVRGVKTMVLLAFLKGVLEKGSVFCGVFVVSSW